MICSDTPVQLQTDECVRNIFPPFRTKLRATAFEQERSPAMEISELRFIVVLSSLNENRKKLKEREDFNGKNIGLVVASL